MSRRGSRRICRGVNSLQLSASEVVGVQGEADRHPAPGRRLAAAARPPGHMASANSFDPSRCHAAAFPNCLTYRRVDRFGISARSNIGAPSEPERITWPSVVQVRTGDLAGAAPVGHGVDPGEAGPSTRDGIPELVAGRAGARMENRAPPRDVDTLTRGSFRSRKGKSGWDARRSARTSSDVMLLRCTERCPSRSSTTANGPSRCGDPGDPGDPGGEATSLRPGAGRRRAPGRPCRPAALLRSPPSSRAGTRPARPAARAGCRSG